MNFIEYLKQLESIKVVDSVESWQDAVKLSFQLLLDKEIITENYIEQTIQKGKELNFYFLIAPHLGMPHSRPEDGVNNTGTSLLVIKNGVKFDDHQHNPIYCLIGLAAVDSNQHVEILMQISELFGENENLIEELKKVNNEQEVLKILEGV